VFASERKKGKSPRSSSVLTWDHLRPAAIAAGVKLKKGQRFGFHNFRHGLASWLVNQGTDVKTEAGEVLQVRNSGPSSYVIDKYGSTTGFVTLCKGRIIIEIFSYEF
jgi:integrase